MGLTVQLLFAGIWALVWAWGIGVGLIVLLCAAAYFSPFFKKDFLYAALIVFAALFSMAYGAKLERARVAAQEKLISQKVTSVVKDTITPVSRGERDPYDSLKN